MFGLHPITVAHTESLGSEVSVQAWNWLMGFEMFQICWEWSDVFGNGVHRFRNAADGFGNAIDGSGRPGMGLGLVRDCSGGVWTASRQKSGCD